MTDTKPTILSDKPDEKKPGRIWLIIAVVFFILLFVPDPIKFIPVIGEGEEILEGGISLSALLIYAVRYWLYKNIKEHIKGKKN
jgi:hypothetical protein